MPEHIKALVYILIVASMTFAIAKKPVISLTTTSDFTRWRNAWLFATLSIFLAQNFWLYLIIFALLAIYYSRKEKNILALFFVMVFSVPPLAANIPGFGVVNYLIEIDQIRLLTLVMLLPFAFSRRFKQESVTFGKYLSDKALICYVILIVLLTFRSTTITDSLRQAFLIYLDIFLLYFVASRSITKIQDFKQVIVGFLFASIIVAAIGITEFIKHWLLYSPLERALQVQSNLGNYLIRGDSLRAVATAGQPIALGYMMVVALGFFAFIQSYIKSKFYRRIALLLLIGGLLAPLSRGPWIGALVTLLILVATGRRPMTQLIKLAGIGIISLLFIGVTPYSEKVFSLIPFIGNTDEGNISYRESLLKNAIIVIQKYPVFGTPDYRDTPEMRELLQGQGIVDVVNSYLKIAMSTGLVGLMAFLAVFISVIFVVRGAMRSVPDKNSETYLLGRSILAAIFGIMVTIFTVSSISIIPMIYWIVLGMGVAYARLVKNSA